ncbi:MAG TPA: ABC transporter ATP-binding protein [Gaiellaceae bacterium]|nr:ABC transporter ATP-binding protein [Gaiellaceae bacterium]
MIVRTDGLTREFRAGRAIVHALRDVDVGLAEGELAVVHGPSGSGKTTLLNLVGGLDRPTAGRVWVAGTEVSGLAEEELVRYRRTTIGFVFQGFGLLPVLTAAENVEVPLRLQKAEPQRRDRRVRELLEAVGLGGRANHRPYELSGGEQQRVAIVRALVNDPPLLLADEPTGQLDSENARTIMELIRDLVDTRGVSALVATHDPALLDVADRVIRLQDGRVVADDREAA